MADDPHAFEGLGASLQQRQPTWIPLRQRQQQGICSSGRLSAPETTGSRRGDPEADRQRLRREAARPPPLRWRANARGCPRSNPAQPCKLPRAGRSSVRALSHGVRPKAAQRAANQKQQALGHHIRAHQGLTQAVATSSSRGSSFAAVSSASRSKGTKERSRAPGWREATDGGGGTPRSNLPTVSRGGVGSESSGGRKGRG